MNALDTISLVSSVLGLVSVVATAVGHVVPGATGRTIRRFGYDLSGVRDDRRRPTVAPYQGARKGR